MDQAIAVIWRGIADRPALYRAIAPGGAFIADRRAAAAGQGEKKREYRYEEREQEAR